MWELSNIHIPSTDAVTIFTIPSHWQHLVRYQSLKSRMTELETWDLGFNCKYHHLTNWTNFLICKMGVIGNYESIRGFPGGDSGQDPTCQCRRPETWVWSLGQEDPLGKGMATHSSILAWRIPWTDKPGGLQFIGSQKSQTWLGLQNHCRWWLKPWN